MDEQYISIVKEEGVVLDIDLFNITLGHADLSRVVIPNRKIEKSDTWFTTVLDQKPSIGHPCARSLRASLGPGASREEGADE